MRKYKTIESIKNVLLASLKTGEGLFVKATNMQSGSHHYWLTGAQDDYIIHCYGSGQNWRDQDDDCGTQDVNELAKKLYRDRKNIIE